MERTPASGGDQMLIARGGVLTIQLDPDPDRPRDKRVELLLVERKLASRLNYKRNNARVVASVEASAGATTAELRIPAWLPDTYSGTNVGWDYEIRVVTDALGVDWKHTTPIVLEGGVPIDTSAEGYTDLRRSAPLRKVTGLGRQKPAGIKSVIFIWLAGGLIAAGFGAANGYVVLLIFGLVVAAFGLLLAIDALTARPLAIDDLVIDVDDRVYHPGDAVEVRITSPIGQGIEIGLEAIEIYIDGGSNRKIGFRKTVVEHYLPLDRSVIRIPVLPSAPGGYAGEEVALHWVVAARQVGTKEKRKRTDTVRIPISRTY